ncbi:MAG: amidohydrolase family protein, partial [Gemmatimonadetes bacterium]|nr:amidohydrolase family protein [Gemmatimonadota bacterium]NIU32039.1 amidohydrolase family protein [Gemmatimonadota bacterium]NIV62410.1 amidohydrolase family protein [Gemmatimonadota bacterium]
MSTLAAASAALAGIVLSASGCGPAPSGDGAAAEYQLLIRGGTVVDGTGAERFRADVAIRDDRIVRVSPAGIAPENAARVLDADGLIVSPGFIDHHAHVQQAIFERSLAESFTRQGITTILASLHSGDQPYPLAEWMDRLESAPNVGFFAGHNWARRRVMGTENRTPEPAELDEMKRLVEEAMQDGALGFSTGLRYIPGNYADTEEIVELARVAAPYGGIYVSHMRDEGPGALESVAELIRIAREAGLPGQIQHHKTMGASQWGLSERTLAMVDSARSEGLDVKLDVYPYTATSTSSRVLFPSWALSGGVDSLRTRLDEPGTRDRIVAGIREKFLRERGGGDLSNIQFARFPAHPEYNGRTLADFAADRGLPNNLESGIRLAIELQLEGGFAGIWHVLDEDDVVRILEHPYAMICTDGDLVGYGAGNPHPRAYGAFPRVLARYVRERGVLSLEEAIRR